MLTNISVSLGDVLNVLQHRPYSYGLSSQTRRVPMLYHSQTLYRLDIEPMFVPLFRHSQRRSFLCQQDNV